MVAKSHQRGHETEYIDGRWVYSDDKSPITTGRPCVRCGRVPTPEGYDACLGYIPNIKSACCGHGIGEGYIDEINHTRKVLDRLGEWQVNSNHTIIIKLDKQ